MKTRKLSLLILATATILTSVAIAYPPDNAAVLYYQTFLTYEKVEGQLADDLSSVVNGKIEPTEEVIKLVKGQHRTIATMTTASLIKKCDWGHNYAEGFDMLLPGLSDMRNITRIVLADAVIKAKDGNYKTAIDRCITVYRMSRHVKDQVLINNLVGIAMEAMATSVLQEVLPQAASDTNQLNKLKVALDDIAVDHNKLVLSMKTEVDSVTKHATPEQIAQTVIEATGSDAKLSDLDKDIPAKGVAYYKEQVEQIINALQLPYSEAVAEINKIEAKMSADNNNKPEAMFANALMPAVAKVLAVSVKSDTDLNAMRTAIEIYLSKAATGNLPNTLPTGMPRDLFSNKDFTYSKTKDGFNLQSQGKNKKTGNPEVYEFKLTK